MQISQLVSRSEYFFARIIIILSLLTFVSPITASAAPALANAVMYEEQSHLLPTESAKDYLFPNSQLGGYNGGVGLMQVTGRVGHEYGYTKTELARNPNKNIDAGIAHISSISNRLNTTNPATIGTTYNGASAYGQRIQAQVNNPNYNMNVVVYGLQKVVESLSALVKSLKE